MLLSACTLIPGEPDTLERIAATLGTLADELIVVCDDPPSPSFCNTAQRLGATILSHQWQKDFSAARNAGLEVAKGEWIFWVDSDETLVAPDAGAFRSLLNRADVLGYYVTIQDTADDEMVMSPRHHRSVYRRREEIRYHGRIHEHFDPPLEDLAARWGMTMSDSPIILRHTGYHPLERPRKLKRNVELLELELRDRPGQIYYLIELGRSLLLMGDVRGHAVMEQAARALVTLLSEANPPVPLVAALLEYALNHAPRGFVLSPADAADAASRWFPNNPVLAWCAARWQYQRGEIAAAAKLLQRVVEMGETGDYDGTISFDRRVFGDETRVNLGVCLAKLGSTDEALEQFKRVSAGSAYFAMAKTNIDRLSGM